MSVFLNQTNNYPSLALSPTRTTRTNSVPFQSLETAVSKDAILDMENLMGPKDLVVGGALTGHAFQGGETVQLTGVTTPWNTLALWDVPKLSKLG